MPQPFRPRLRLVRLLLVCFAAATLHLLPSTLASASASSAAGPKASIHQDQQGGLHIRSGGNQSVFVNDVDVVEEISTAREQLRNLQAQYAILQTNNAALLVENAALRQDLRLLNASVTNGFAGVQQRLNDLEAYTAAPNPQTTVSPATLSPPTTPTLVPRYPVNNGTRAWTRQLGTSAQDEATGVAVDGNSFAYVCGYSNGGIFDGKPNIGSFDMFLVKYDRMGAKIWSILMGSSSTSAPDYAYAVVTDSTNNVFLAGAAYSNFDGHASKGSYDAVLVKFNNNGVKKWSKQIGTSGSDGWYSLAADADDNIVAAGHASGDLDGTTNSGGRDAFLAKFTNDGVNLWSRQFGSPAEERIYGVASDGNNDIIAVGYTEGGLFGNTNAGMSDIFVAKFGANGTLLWYRQFGSDEQDQPNGVAVGSDNSVYVVGYSSGDLDGFFNIGLSDVVVFKLDKDGNKLWTRKPVATVQSDTANALAVDRNDFVYVGGSTNDDAFLVQLDSTGAIRWHQELGTAEYDSLKGLAVDTDSSVWGVGSTSGGLHGNQNAGSQDVFVTRFL